jgi:hypothetical protein
MEVAKDIYEWEPLSEKWQVKLNADNFMIKNCLGDGNCQFRSIESALMNTGVKMTHKRLRNMIAKYIKDIPQGEFVDIIENYRIEKDNREFIGDWDPYNIHNKRDFIKQIRMTGFHFQGDDVTLSLLSRVLKMDFIIFNSDYSITDLKNDENIQDKIILLYFDKDKGHYQTLGIRKSTGKIETVINRMKTPKELLFILDKNEFYLSHIKKICEEKVCERLILNDLLKELEERIQMKVSLIDKRVVIKLIKNWLQNEMYFMDVSTMRIKKESKVLNN